MPKCKKCGSTDFVHAYTETAGDVSCQTCGWVLEESALVADLQWSEGPGGASHLNGQTIRADQTSGNLKSREITIMNARRKINALAYSLGIPDTIAAQAASWFNLALSVNFVKGRKSQNVVAACLYVACRKSKTHHMLVDFSLKLQVSVYSIGLSFLKLVRALNITKLPLTDPLLFIQHFADRLDFGNKKVKVIRDAIKLAQRMAHDWIYEGRRPSGIAGACILLAARMNNFRRTHAEIVALAHVGQETIQRRMNEFKATKLGKMSIAEFRQSQNEDIEPSLPPIMIKQAKKVQKKRREMDEVSTSLIERFIRCEIDAGEIDENVKVLCERIGEKAKKKRKNNEDNEGDEDEEKEEKEASEESNDEATDERKKVEKARQVAYDKQTRMIEENRPRNLSCLPTTEQILSIVPDGEENFSDLDDEELDECLLSPEDAAVKERIFINLNGDYLLEQQEKELKKEADEIAGHNSKPHRRKKRKTEDEALVNGVVRDLTDAGLRGDLLASASMKSMLRIHQPTAKLNYEAIDTILDDI